MIKKNWLVKALSVAMAIMMVVGVMAPVVSASSATEGQAKETINYVSIGDSMTNGYGFLGYDQAGTKADGYDFLAGEKVYGEGSYALQFEKYLEKYGTVNHTKLALSGFRAEDLAFLLGLTDLPVDGYFEVCFDYAFHTQNPFDPNGADAERIEILKNHYQTNIKNADVITLALGNASFNAFFIDRAMRAFNVMGAGYDETHPQVTLEDALALVKSEEDKELVLEVYEMLMEELMAVIPADAAEDFNLDVLCGLAAYTTASFVLSYKAIIDWIAENNPEATVILVGVLNSNEGMTVVGDGFEFDLGSVMGEIYDTLSAYMAAIPASYDVENRVNAGVDTLVNNLPVIDKENYEATLESVKDTLTATSEALNKAYGTKFLFAAQPENPEMVAGIVDEIAAAGWGTYENGNGIVDGAIIRKKTIVAYSDFVAPMIASGLLGLDADAMAITADEVAAYEAGEHKWTLNAADLLPSALDPVKSELVGTVFTGYGDDVKTLSIVIYLSLEAAVVKSLESGEIELGAVSTFLNDMTSIFNGAPNPDPTATLEAFAGYDWFGDTVNSVNAANDAIAALSPDALQAEFTAFFCEEETMLPLVRLFAMNKVGNGISAHPTPATHDGIYASVVKAYETNYTATAETLKNVLELIDYATYLILEYYDEAYAEAYKYAEEEGYIAAAIEALEVAINAIENADLSVLGVTAELEAELAAELAATVATLKEIKEVLATGSASTVDGLVAAIFELEDDLYTHLANIEAIAVQAGIDVNTLVIIPAIEAAMAAVKEAVETIVAKVQAQVKHQIEVVWGVVVEINTTVENVIAQVRKQLATAYRVYEYAVAVALYIKENLTLENISNIVRDYVESKSEEIAAVVEAIRNHVAEKMEETSGLVNATGAVIEAVLEVIESGEFAPEDIVAALRFHFANAFAGEITLNEDFFYVAIAEEAGYAEVLANVLHLNADQYTVVAIEDVTAELIEKADFITVEYDDTCAVNFAVEQLLGLANGYYESTVDFVEAVNEKLSPVIGAYGIDLVELVEAGLSTVEGYAEIKAAIEGKTVETLDWAALLGEEHVAIVDAFRAELKETLASTGKLETVSYSVDVVEEAAKLISENSNGLLNLDSAKLAEMLGEHSVYSIEINLVDVVAFAIESAIYEYISFNVEYATAINTITEINPEATIALLGNYNRYDFGSEIVIGEVTLTVGELLGYANINTTFVPSKVLEYVVAEEVLTVADALFAVTYVSTLNPAVNAVVVPNAFYVDIVNAPVAGDEYVANQILAALTIKGDMNDHNWVEVSRTEGDCQTLVEITEECTYCGETRVVYGTYGEHNWTEATCTAAKTCTICGTTAGEALAHTEVVVPGKDATCTEAGLTEGKKCSVCGEVLVAQTEIAALGHTEVVVPGKDATCTEAGLTEGKKCSVCGETLVAQTEIAAKGHVEEIIPAVEPTHSAPGSTEGKKCSVCGEILVAPQVIPAKSLAWLWITIASVAVLGGAAVAVYFFVIKKKKVA